MLNSKEDLQNAAKYTIPSIFCLRYITNVAFTEGVKCPNSPTVALYFQTAVSANPLHTYALIIKC